ncbi:(2Fe-2S)-binding protein [Ensifer adhaerens]|uniref:(2Fe-2S)-binding protein n=1 Tax=Ensifer adhaerens TaxID=106592 RepID=A0A9Q8YG84_ENSAD|nr:(2Fe-2S)-binding protein [Ensifer adhaerens]USJ27651.1 (2Fe-2S)-binding protein [Ensifer adhaerens]
MTESSKTATSAGRIVRLAEQGRRQVTIRLDGVEHRALEGDTVLTAILLSRHIVRQSEFGPEGRAGFCLMGACQDCWVWREDGSRLRACSTLVEDGLELRIGCFDGWEQ